MKRSYFLKQLITLPFGTYIIQKLFKNEQQHLLNKFYVAGFQYYRDPSFIEDIQPGEQLKLKAMPENQHDKFAVAIHRKSRMIGYVPRTDNKHISRLLQQGVNVVCKAKEVHPDKDTWKMLKVEVYL